MNRSLVIKIGGFVVFIPLISLYTVHTFHIVQHFDGPLDFFVVNSYQSVYGGQQSIFLYIYLGEILLLIVWFKLAFSFRKNGALNFF